VSHRSLVLASTVALLMAVSLPASAHVIQVSHPQTGETISTHNGKAFEEFKQEAAELGFDVGWVGGFHSFAAHGSGLIDACEATTGNDVVFIGAPWNEDNHCKHFGH
jgi:hypothetical protein